jgi:hypothetical protein
MIFVIKFSASIFVTMISVRFAFGIYVCVCSGVSDDCFFTSCSVYFV